MFIFHPGLDIDHFESIVVKVLRTMSHTNLETHALVSLVSGNRSDKIESVDKMQLQPHKVNCWLWCVYGYYVNGTKIFLKKT